jgi:hypothetical protein
MGEVEAEGKREEEETLDTCIYITNHIIIINFKSQAFKAWSDSTAFPRPFSILIDSPERIPTTYNPPFFPHTVTN